VSEPATPSARRFADIMTAGFVGLALGVVSEMTLAHKPPPAPVAEAHEPVVIDAGRPVWVEDVERRLGAAAQKLDEHTQRIHDLEILNRAQCK